MMVSELTGDWLNYWVARAEGHEWRCHWMLEKSGIREWQSYEQAWGAPTPPYLTEWEFGGHLIQTYHLAVAPHENGWMARSEYSFWAVDESLADWVARGNTPLEAICRAVVRAKFGDEVEEIGVTE